MVELQGDHHAWRVDWSWGVGAVGCTVTEPVPPFTIDVGVPAFIIGERGCGSSYDLGRGRPTPFV